MEGKRSGNEVVDPDDAVAGAFAPCESGVQRDCLASAGRPRERRKRLHVADAALQEIHRQELRLGEEDLRHGRLTQKVCRTVLVIDVNVRAPLASGTGVRAQITAEGNRPQLYPTCPVA